MPSLKVVNENMTYVQALRAIEGAYGCKLVIEPGEYWPGGDAKPYPVWWVRFIDDAHRREWANMEDIYFLRLGEDMLHYDQALTECLSQWEHELDYWMRLNA